MIENNSYVQAFRGRFTSLMQWQDLDEFWKILKQQADGHWYIYAIGEEAPTSSVSPEKLIHFIDELDVLLRTEHKEDYCAIVYVDSKSRPEFIKVFDPNNLGVTCGFSDNPPLPNWAISKIAPTGITTNMLVTQKRKRWWNKIFG